MKGFKPAMCRALAVGPRNSYGRIVKGEQIGGYAKMEHIIEALPGTIGCRPFLVEDVDTARVDDRTGTIVQERILTRRTTSRPSLSIKRLPPKLLSGAMMMMKDDRRVVCLNFSANSCDLLWRAHMIMD